MKYYIKREQLICELERHFPSEISYFPEELSTELTSLLALAISGADEKVNLKCFERAIQHITKQHGLTSYSSLTEQQKLCVDIFAQQTISQQEHIVFCKGNYRDTLRIYDAPVQLNKIYETSDKPLESENSNGFIDGFISLLRKLQGLISSMVSSKTGDSHEK